VQGCSCVKCGADIKYIPSGNSVIVVDTREVEIITDRGRVVKGYFRHDCPAKKESGHENKNNL